MKIRVKCLFTIFIFAAVSYAEKPEQKPGGKGSAGMAKHLLKMMDINRDDKISKDEWQAHHDQRFAEIDADRDGVITPKEIKEHRKKMRSKRAEICPDCPYSKKGMRKGPRHKTLDEEE